MQLEVNVYKNTGMEYIRGKGRTLLRLKGERSGMFITNEEFDAWDAQGKLFSQVLGLKNDKGRGGYDFDRTAAEGKAFPLLPDTKPETSIDSTEPLPEVPEDAAPVPLVNEPNEADEAMAVEEAKVEPEQPTLHEHNTRVIESIMEHAMPVEKAKAMFEAAINDKLDPDYVKSLNNFYTEKDRQQLLEQFRKDGETEYDRTGLTRPVKEQKKKPKGSIVSIHTSRNVMMGILIIVGILSLVMSTYHIIMYLWEPRGPFVAVVSAVAMTLFSSSAFTTGRYFFFLGRDTELAPGEAVAYRKFLWFKFRTRPPKGAVKNRLIAATFWAFGIGVVIYAMFATMDVNFNNFRDQQTAKVAVAVKDDSAVNAAKQTDTDLRSEATRLDGVLAKADSEEAPWLAEVNRLTRVMSNPATTDDQRTAASASRDSAQYRINVIENRIRDDRKKRGEIGDKLTNTGTAKVTAENTVKAAEESGTFFALLNQIFGWDIQTLKLIVYVIPAVFYDLMSPFALTVVMILEEKREEDEAKDEDLPGE